MENNITDAYLLYALGHDVKAMKDLPDLSPIAPIVYDGVNIKIEMGSIMGGWTLTVDGPKVVWFLLSTTGRFMRLES